MAGRGEDISIEDLEEAGGGHCEIAKTAAVLPQLRLRTLKGRPIDGREGPARAVSLLFSA